MIIKDVKVQTIDDTLKVSAKCKIRKIGWDEVYFTFHKKYQSYITADASAFAAALIIPCMKQGEDLIIKGSISRKLYQNMQKMMPVVLPWGLGLKKINIQVDAFTKDTYKPTHTATFFSGGVDSFYTYLKNKTNKHGRVSHFILVNGYDIDIRNKKLWEMTVKNVRAIASTEKIELIEVESNLYRLLEPIILWNFSCVGGLAAIGLLLRKKLKKVYRSSAFNKELITGSLDMVIDHFFNTETIAFAHDGAEATRVQKVKKIAESQLVLDTLRVCYVNQKGVYNCGKCEKCLRTMIALLIAGKLSRSKTFPTKLNYVLLKQLRIEDEFGAIFHRENLAELKKLKLEPDLQRILETGLKNIAKEKSPHLSETIINTSIYLDHIYNKGRIFNTISGKKRKF